MAENGGSKLGYFLAGLGLGAVIALLFAPRSGEETRQYLRERAEEGVDDLKRRGRELKERAGEVVEKGKELAERHRESVEAALEAGKTAYREEKRRM